MSVLAGYVLLSFLAGTLYTLCGLARSRQRDRASSRPDQPSPVTLRYGGVLQHRRRIRQLPFGGGVEVLERDPAVAAELVATADEFKPVSRFS